MFDDIFNTLVHWTGTEDDASHHSSFHEDQGGYAGESVPWFMTEHHALTSSPENSDGGNISTFPFEQHDMPGVSHDPTYAETHDGAVSTSTSLQEHSILPIGNASTHNTELNTFMWYQIVPQTTYWNPADFHGIGHPISYSQYWHQQTREDCAVMAQGEVLESITHRHLTEQQLCQIAQSHGWYDPKLGTFPQHVGNILTLFGVPVEHKEHANFADVVTALQHEQRVIVGLNANEIWHPCRDSVTGEPVKLPYEGHAVWVTGIDPTPSGVKVILADSGTPNGRMEAVDVQDFLNAWWDAGNFMVVADPHVTHPIVFGGHYNADGTYHYDSDNTDRDPQTQAIVRQYP